MKKVTAKKLKGMTLIEIVVAIAILGLGSTMLVSAFAVVSMTNRETHQFNERMCQQVKFAENASEDSSLASVANNIKIKVEGGASFTSGTEALLAGDSYWVDVDAPASDTMVDESIDFKYYNVFIPPEKPDTP